MATTRTFNAMLNQYLPNKLLREELIEKNYILKTCRKDNNWKGGSLIVPFRGAESSSVAFGALTGSTDIAESELVRGSISTQPELWGSLIFNQRDLQEHDGKIPESTFLRILPDEIDYFMKYLNEVVSIQLGTGPHFATATGYGTAGDASDGQYIVDHPERMYLGQKTSLDDDNSAATDAYVIAIDMNTKIVEFSATRGGAAANLSAYTVAQNAKFYHPGAQAAPMTSMRSVFLSLANGGSANVHGVAKTAYPFLQAINVSGATITSTNVIEKIFDSYTEVCKLGKGTANKVLMSYKHLGSVLKSLQVSKGGFQVVKEPVGKTQQFGWSEIVLASVKSGMALTLVGIQEMDDDIMPFVNFDTLVFRSNGFFRKRKAPDGKEYFEIRNTSGYQYICDVCLFGDMEYSKPGENAIIHSIPNY